MTSKNSGKLSEKSKKYIHGKAIEFFAIKEKEAEKRGSFRLEHDFYQENGLLSSKTVFSSDLMFQLESVYKKHLETIHKSNAFHETKVCMEESCSKLYEALVEELYRR